MNVMTLVNAKRLPFWLAKDFWSLDWNHSVVGNVLGQLTESRGTNEDRL